MFKKIDSRDHFETKIDETYCLKIGETYRLKFARSDVIQCKTREL